MEVDNADKVNEETIAREIHAEATVVALEKEETNPTNSERPPNAKETSECFAKSEGLNSSSIASEGAAIVSERKISNAPRKGTNMKGSGRVLQRASLAVKRLRL
ncbi:hypothetical protein OIU78_019756 [Salix suchowensis]|nr:hypothetical protein OIU78_019756 [Salix suchowensis]